MNTTSLKDYKVGDRIGGKYEIRNELGQGGCGVVYEVKSIKNGEIYALKTFHRELLVNKEARNRFRKEAEVWISLDRHPNIVRAHHVDEFNGRLYIAMELIPPDYEGLSSLKDYIERRPPNLRQSLQWAIQSCFGMEHVISKGLRCHRDIKPANIMITNSGIVKITDFGLAGLVSGEHFQSVNNNFVDKTSQILPLTKMGAIMGTPAYMAPEQFEDSSTVDIRSDIYSFGIILFHFCAKGQFPFFPSPYQSDPFNAFYNLHKHAKVPFIDSPLYPIALRCLSKNKIDRYQSFDAVRNDLEILLKKHFKETIKLPQIDKYEIWDLNDKGCALDNLEHHNEALQCFEDAIDIDDGKDQIWYNKAVCLQNMKRYPHAIICYDNAISINPLLPNALLKKAECLELLGKTIEANTIRQFAFTVSPRDISFWFTIGNEFMKARNYELSIKCFEKVLREDGENINALIKKGKASEYLNNFQNAISCYLKAIDIDPRFVYGIYCLANIYLLLKKYPDALSAIDNLLNIEENYPPGLFIKGRAEHLLGLKNKAIVSYERYLSVVAPHKIEEIAIVQEFLQKLRSERTK